MKIVWKDIFKPRYGLIVELVDVPVVGEESGSRICRRRVPAVVRLPVKRPLSMPFNEFYNALSSSHTMHFCGSKRVLSKLYGIGSAEKHNLKNATVFRKNCA